MKKYFTLLSGVFTALFFSSCAKDFECECTYTYTYSSSDGQTQSTSTTNSTTLKETTKDVARRNCLSIETTETDTYDNVTYTYTYVNDCKLK
jgi:hypothetical protein